ncbi:hypothetical protein TeGR_g3888, partial [Tetraparma gracilis]
SLLKDTAEEAAALAAEAGGSTKKPPTDLRILPVTSASAASTPAQTEAEPSTPGAAKESSQIRMRLFPKVREKLEASRAAAKQLMRDPNISEHEKDVIAQQYAGNCLLTLRQLRHHCMESKLDGWRHGTNQRKMLIVDDSLVTRKLIARAFKKAGFVVDLACDGTEGLEKMKSSIY